MSCYNVKFSCGHEGEVTITGTRQVREHMLWVYENRRSCEACEAIERAKELADAEERAKTDELPELRGSEKQVAWAMTIRDNQIASAERSKQETQTMLDNVLKASVVNMKNKERLEQCLELNIELLSMMSKEDSAHWWIENRALSLAQMYKSLKQRHDVTEKSAEEAIDPLAQNAIKEATLRPENVTKGIVTVEISGDMLIARYPRDDDFQRIVKKMRFKWSPEKATWLRQIVEINGAIEDRAAEIVNMLLDNGFIVTCLNELVRDKAVRADFEPECDNWILRGGDDKLRVRFPKDEKMSENVRRMGGRWDRECGAYVVSAAQYKDLQELARLYGFRFTSRAAKVVDEYTQRELNATCVQVAEVVKPKLASDPLAAILDSSRDILPDLKDD